MLDPFSRGAIIALSALCAAAAISLAPIRARGSVEDIGPGQAAWIASTAADPVVALPIGRDPFAQPAARQFPLPTPATPIAPTPARGPLPSGSIESLPSNLSGDSIPAVPGTAPDAPPAARITAIVTGTHPYAMIEAAGVHEIKGIGDRLGAATIVGIDLDGIRLAGGARLSVAAAGRR